MNEYLLSIIIITIGFIISFLLYIFLHKLTNNIVRMFQLYAWSQDALKLILRIFSSFVCVIVFLMFLRKALTIIGLVFTVDFIENILLSSGKYFSAFIVIVLGLYLSRRVNDRLKGLNTVFQPYIYFISSLIVNTAFILTGLTIIGVNIIIFLEVYKILLLTIGITLSLIIGIPMGMYISNKINKKKKTRKK
jgi:hypothetical protein